MCTEYLFDGIAVDCIRDLQALISGPIEWRGGNTAGWPHPDELPDHCLCGVDVRATALASGWIETDPPDGDFWPYGGCFTKDPRELGWWVHGRRFSGRKSKRNE